MAKVRVAINGFGRIGRLTTRYLLKNNNVTLVAVNDLTDVNTLAHLFKYDSSQGEYKGEVYVDRGQLVVDGHTIEITAIRDPAKLDWGEQAIDVVLECTGVFRKREEAALHLQAGAQRVLISAPAKSEGIPTIVRGINESILSEDDRIVSNASCTTNCLAPMVKVLMDNWGFERAFMSTVHAYTGNQRIQDAPHKDLRRARAAAINIIPTSTGAAKALELVIPEVAGKISASALRVPVVCGSLVELVVQVSQNLNKATVNAAFKKAADHELKGILQYVEAPLVSSDIIGNLHSSIFDAALTEMNGNLLKITSWYDNEAGYSARLAELAASLQLKS